MRTFFNARSATLATFLVAALGVAGCGSAVESLCEHMCECEGDCRDDDVDECVAELEEAEHEAEDRGCEDEWEDVIECADDNQICADNAVFDANACREELVAYMAACGVDLD